MVGAIQIKIALFSDLAMASLKGSCSGNWVPGVVRLFKRWPRGR